METMDIEVAPRTNIRGYVKLSEIIKDRHVLLHKTDVSCDGEHLFVDGRKIHGFKTNGERVLIEAEHYTSWEEATQIRSMKRIEGSLLDPYAYVVEKDVLDGHSEREKRKLLGAQHADTKIKITLRVDVDQVWVKSEKHHPLKFGIKHGIQPYDIESLELERQR